MFESIKINLVTALDAQFSKYLDKDFKKSILYRKALSIEPNNPKIHSCGILLEKMGDFSKAIDAYKKAIEIDPKYSESMNNLAVLLYKQKRYDECKSF